MQQLLGTLESCFLKLAECSHNMETAKQTPQDLEQLLGLRFFFCSFFSSMNRRQAAGYGRRLLRPRHLPEIRTSTLNLQYLQVFKKKTNSD